VGACRGHEGAGEAAGWAWSSVPYPGDGSGPAFNPVPAPWPAPVWSPTPAGTTPGQVWPTPSQVWPTPTPSWPTPAPHPLNPTPSWPVWSTRTTGTHRPTLHGAPDPLVVEAVTGRAHQAQGFWAFAGALVALLLFPSALLAVWALWFGGSDHERSAQVAWSIILAVTVLGASARLSLTGTKADDWGLRRTTLFGSTRVAWAWVDGFAGGCDGRPGLWLTTTTAPDEPLQVPSSMHATPLSEARATAAWISEATGLLEVPPRRTASGRPRLAGRLWIRWTWFLPLLTAGMVTPIVLFVGAILTRRRWMWLAWAVSIDLFTVFLASVGAPTLCGTAGMVLWLVAPLVLFTVVIVSGRRQRLGALGEVDRPLPR
jgi:hypothetical protein